VVEGGDHVCADLAQKEQLPNLVGPDVVVATSAWIGQAEGLLWRVEVDPTQGSLTEEARPLRRTAAPLAAQGKDAEAGDLALLLQDQVEEATSWFEVVGCHC